LAARGPQQRTCNFSPSVAEMNLEVGDASMVARIPRHAPLCAGHPRLSEKALEDVGGRDKPGP
jgi:hypothetical protein